MKLFIISLWELSFDLRFPKINMPQGILTNFYLIEESNKEVREKSTATISSWLSEKILLFEKKKCEHDRLVFWLIFYRVDR